MTSIIGALVRLLTDDGNKTMRPPGLFLVGFLTEFINC